MFEAGKGSDAPHGRASVKLGRSATASGGAHRHLKEGADRWSISQIKLDRRNCRTHSDRQIGQIANSIGASGSTNPLLVSEDGTLIAGEGRFDPSWLDASAVRKLGGATLQALRSSCRLSNGGRHA